MIRVTKYFVEVDHAVKGAAGPYPLIDLLSSSLLYFRVVPRNRDTLKWIQRTTDYLDAAHMSACNQLPICIDHILGVAPFGRIRQRYISQPGPRKSDIVQSLK